MLPFVWFQLRPRDYLSSPPPRSTFSREMRFFCVPFFLSHVVDASILTFFRPGLLSPPFSRALSHVIPTKRLPSVVYVYQNPRFIFFSHCLFFSRPEFLSPASSFDPTIHLKLSGFFVLVPLFCCALELLVFAHFRLRFLRVIELIFFLPCRNFGCF